MLTKKQTRSRRRLPMTLRRGFEGSCTWPPYLAGRDLERSALFLYEVTKIWRWFTVSAGGNSARLRVHIGFRAGSSMMLANTGSEFVLGLDLEGLDAEAEVMTTSSTLDQLEAMRKGDADISTDEA